MFNLAKGWLPCFDPEFSFSIIFFFFYFPCSPFICRLSMKPSWFARMAERVARLDRDSPCHHRLPQVGLLFSMKMNSLNHGFHTFCLGHDEASFFFPFLSANPLRPSLQTPANSLIEYGSSIRQMLPLLLLLKWKCWWPTHSIWSSEWWCWMPSTLHSCRKLWIANCKVRATSVWFPSYWTFACKNTNDLWCKSTCICVVRTMLHHFVSYIICSESRARIFTHAS